MKEPQEVIEKMEKTGIFDEEIDTKRQGEIALALIKIRIRKTPVRIGREFNRELGGVARNTGISLEELKIFFRIQLEEAIQETFGTKKFYGNIDSKKALKTFRNRENQRN